MTVETPTEESGQAETIAFLASGTAFGEVPVRHIETHISQLFLVGGEAYKLKRARRLNFLDFSTLEQRRIACEREVELNRRTAPALYLGTLPVTREKKGLALDSTGQVVDWLVHMRRFDDGSRLDELAARGALDRPLIGALGEQIIAFHAGAEKRTDKGGAKAMQKIADNVTGDLRRAAPDVFDLEPAQKWKNLWDRELAKRSALLDQRRASGLVRHCHGDMHLANICVFEGTPTLFDCIEFSDDIACIDVLYDLAFTLMDLIHRGLPELANFLLNRYLSATRDYSGCALMPLFLSLRAAIRAMAELLSVHAGQSESAPEIEEAEAYLALALRLLGEPEPKLIAIGGLSGSGKSTLARRLAPQLAPGAGAVVVSSDVIRKRLFGVPPEEKLGKEAYSPDASARTYGRLYEDVSAALAAGQTVVADATFLREVDRVRVGALAGRHAVPFRGIWLDAPYATLVDRADSRVVDASDADKGVIDLQRGEELGQIAWDRLDSTDPDLVSNVMVLCDPPRSPVARSR